MYDTDFKPGSLFVNCRCWADTAKFTNVIVAGFRKCRDLVGEGKVFIKDKKPRLRAKWVVVREKSWILCYAFIKIKLASCLLLLCAVYTCQSHLILKMRTNVTSKNERWSSLLHCASDLDQRSSKYVISLFVVRIMFD